MYGDTEVMRKHAARLREQGGDIRVLADQLVSQVEGIDWRGRAADTMRDRMRERASRLREAAGRHDVAADSLEKHLSQVEADKESIATTQRRTTALVGDARARVERLHADADVQGVQGVGAVARSPDPIDEELVAFTPPAPGHKDWLTVELPGL